MQARARDDAELTFATRPQEAGAASIMNAVILSAILPAGNSGMYASTRMLYTMAMNGQVPRFFGRLSVSVPRYALYATTVIGGLCFLTTFVGDKVIYVWLLNTSGMCGFIVWLGILTKRCRFVRYEEMDVGALH